MVAGFQDDLDLDDKIPSRAVLATERVPSKNITLSSEEEEEEEAKDSRVALIPDESIDMEREIKRYEAQPEEWDCAGKLESLLTPLLLLGSGKTWCLSEPIPSAVSWSCICLSWNCFMQYFLRGSGTSSSLYDKLHHSSVVYF